MVNVMIFQLTAKFPRMGFHWPYSENPEKPGCQRWEVGPGRTGTIAYDPIHTSRVGQGEHKINGLSNEVLGADLRT